MTLVSVEFRFGSALVLFSVLFVEACHCVLLRTPACLCVLLGLNLLSEGRKLGGVLNIDYFDFFFKFLLTDILENNVFCSSRLRST